MKNQIFKISCADNTKTITVHLDVSPGERVIRDIKKAFLLKHYWTELTGVVGEEEARAELFSPFGFGNGKMQDEAGYLIDITAFYFSIPDFLDKTNVDEFLDKARSISKKYMPVLDNRETKEERAIRFAEFARQRSELDEKRKTEVSKFVQEHGYSDQPVETPEGCVAITVQLCYDNSDPMTDYYADHCPYGPSFVVGYVPRGTQHRESVIRAAIEKYPQLSRWTWEWHKENYSMGHGNWLQSNPIGRADEITTYGGVKSPQIWWEARIVSWNEKHLPIKGFNQREKINTDEGKEGSDVNVVVKHEREWTWLEFTSKPAEQIREKLKSAGARFSSRRTAWFFTRHVEQQDVLALIGG